MTSNNFLGRTVAVINDLTLDERRHLYSKAKELKEAMIRKDRALLNKFKINDEYFGMRRAFLEDSTRTKGSFTSAMEFLNVNEHDFDVDHSSINKSESYFDSINTLVGYDDDVFVIRSKLEGVCRYLEEKTYDLGYLHTLDKPAFVNAGDGKHEHPTQEILDGYTFLEDNHWDYSHLHIALIGDLFHGRTIHSKVDGLKIFHNVKVDLIAPNEIALQDYYVKRMEENGFEIRTFESIEEYLDQKDISKQWYFTRPQLERMGEKVLAKQDELRKGITASVEFLRHLEDDTHFYHPLPRHKEHPTLPTELDGYSVNGWTRQSKNGKLTRIVLLGAIAGVPYICDDFEGQSLEKKVYEDNFIEPLIVENSGVKNYKQGVRPLKNGVVIDHISRGSTPQEIHYNMNQIQKILGLYDIGGSWVAESESNSGVYKGLIFLPNTNKLKEKEMKRLAAISPNCRVNVIEDHKVKEKLLLNMPDQIYNFKEISCTNENCISSYLNKEPMGAHFYNKEGIFECKYCEKPHNYKEIWKK